MKFRKRILGSFLTFSLCSTPAVVSALTWNTGGPTDGWTLTAGNANWEAGAEWTDGSNAVFAAPTGETVTLTGAVSPLGTTVGDNGGSWIFSGTGSIAGGSLAKNGAGLLTLSNSGPNAFSATTVNAGTLEVTGSVDALLNGVTVTNPGTLFLNVQNAGGVDITYANNVEGTGSLKVAARGTGAAGSVLAGSLGSFTGIMDIYQSPAGGGKVKLAGPSQLSVPNSFAKIRVQSGATLYSATGFTYINNVELYGGTTGEAFGQVRLEANTTLAGNMTLKANATIGSNSGTGFFSGIIGDEGNAFSLTKQGGGTSALTGQNTYSGPTIIAAGTLQIGNNGTTGGIVPTSTVTLGSATTVLNFNRSNDIVFANLIDGSGQPYTTTAGAVLKNGAGALTLSGANTFTGGFRHNTGTLVLSGDSLPAAGPLASGPLGIGTVDLRAGSIRAVDTTPRLIRNPIVYSGNLAFGSATTGNLEFSGSVAAGDAAKTMTINNSVTKLSGVISGTTAANGLTKDGSGVLLLSGANTSVKNFNVTGGTLNLSNPLALQFSTLSTIANGIVFDSSVIPGAFTFGGLGGSGGFTLTDNAVSPAAIALSIGNNNAAATHTGVISGPGSIRKIGTGVQTLSGANTYSGVTTLAAGTLSVTSINNGGVAGNLGQATGDAANLVFAGGTLRYVGGSAFSNRNFTIGSGVAAGIEVSNASTNLTLSGTGEGFNGGLTKSGPGTLTLSGANLYSGVTTVSAGTLNVTGAIGNVNVVSGGTLRGSGSTGTISFQSGSNFVAGTTALLSQGVEAVASPVNVSLASPPVGTGSHSVDLINYGGGGVSGLSNYAVSSFRSGSVTNDAVNTCLKLSFVSEAKTWNAISDTWDTNGPGSPWIGGTDGKFFQGDAVTFPTLASDATVTLTGVLVPSSLTVSNTANTYTFSGAGSIGGTAGLLKSGAGSLVLSTANTFSGKAVISGGVLKIGNAAALGLGGVGNETVVESGATLDVNAMIMNAASNPEIINLIGTGVGGLGALVNTGAGQINALNQVVLAGDAAIGGSGRFDLRVSAIAPTPQLDLAGHTLTKLGTSQVSLVGAAVTDGNIIIDGGILGIEAASAVGGSGTITVNGTGTLGFFGNIEGNLTRPIVSKGGTLQNLGSDATVSSPIHLESAVTLAGGNKTTLKGEITETPGTPATLTKTGGGTFVLTTANTFTGAVTLSGGIIQMGTGTSLGSGPIAQAGGRLILGAGTEITVNQPISMTGTGGVAGAGLISTGGINATLNGAISITGPATAGGHFFGASGSNILTLNGAITSTATVTQRDGNVMMTGGGSIPTYQLTGLLKIGAMNGAPSNAIVQLGVSGGGTVDLNGFNQTFAGINKAATAAANITNNGTAPAILTVNDATGSTYAGTITAGTGGALSFVKEGVGTLVLSGANTYAGDTSVNAGVLSLTQASLGDQGAVRIAASATLDLGHTLTDTVKELYLGGERQAAGKWGRINSIVELGATHESALITGNGLLEVTSGTSVAYADWATFHQLPPGQNSPGANPDDDRLNNLGEFAFDGSPLSGTSDGKIRVKVGSVNSQQVLTLTLPMRSGTSFLPGNSGELVSNPVDGVVYRIQGSDDLVTFNLHITEVTGPDLIPIQQGLPLPLSEGWSYRTFRAPGVLTDANNPKDFLRAKVSE